RLPAEEKWNDLLTCGKGLLDLILWSGRHVVRGLLGDVAARSGARADPAEMPDLHRNRLSASGRPREVELSAFVPVPESESLHAAGQRSREGDVQGCCLGQQEAVGAKLGPSQ